MDLDPNFSEFIASLHAREVRFLIVGGYAVGMHGHPRYTADLDVWLRADEANARALLGALEDFGFADLDLTTDDFLTPEHVVQLGYPPLRIDLLTSIDGVDFAEAYERRVEVMLDDLMVPVISLNDLRRNKQTTGRAQDLADLEALEDDRA
jgi:hypothetical protein